MTRKEFLEKADELHIDPRSFGLFENADEAYVVVHESRRWTTFYGERGLRTAECHFRTEEDALDDLFRRMSSEPGARELQR